ncbi:MAG TPA: VOC family protein [Steroidobacteraceae bacterium]|jgi:DNA-binding CsgD family transcriptional regulator/catechol 2,3-dioxygenase-like lactoylglutathione lyase family enzyme|nr:VOC family protein [Steroidobacteraceae bacterium]
MRTRRGRPPHDDLLTPAEWRAVHAVQHGMTNREIAERRGVSLDAIKFHVSNAIAKLGIGNRRALRRWFRVPRHSALYRKEITVNEALKLGPIGQISRSVNDIAQSEAWYGKVLGLPHLYTFGKLAFFDCNGTRLMLTQEGAAAADSIIYLRVADIRGAHDELRSRGVEFVSAPHLVHKHANGIEEWMAFFKDPEGRTLAIMSQV